MGWVASIIKTALINSSQLLHKGANRWGQHGTRAWQIRQCGLSQGETNRMGNPMIRTLFAFIAFFFIAVGTAHADPFTVAGIYVDANGDNAIEAQTKALGDGQQRAAMVLVQRVTVEDARGVNMTAEDAGRMIRAMSIADEKRTSSRYFGTITVAFNPQAVKAFTDRQGLTFVASQSSPRLVIPMVNGQIVDSGNWYDYWAGGAGQNSLTPAKVIAAPQRVSSFVSASDAASGNVDALARLGKSQNVSQIVVADVTPSGGGFTVSVRDVALDKGTSESLGTVSAPTLAAAGVAVSEKLEARWKRSLTQSSGPTQTIVVTVLYRDLQSWQRLQAAINGASAIKGARLDALSKDGALMSLTIEGDGSALANEMRYKGVTFETQPNIGPVLRLSRG